MKKEDASALQPGFKRGMFCGLILGFGIAFLAFVLLALTGMFGKATPATEAEKSKHIYTLPEGKSPIGAGLC